ncbi:MAG: MATE family efflux transporter [Nitriliruptorales bacterium]|nr:MATE family efflux transporter [Nitriliruptorales bacterium]
MTSDAPPRSSRERHRRILALAVPAMATLVADPLLGFVDTAVVGRVGASELGALGLAVAVLAALSWIFNFLVYGTTAAVARAAGAGDDEAAGRRVAHAAQFAVGLGLASGLAVFVAARPLLELVGAVPELVDPAASYLRIRALGVPFFLLAFVGHGAFRGVADTRTPLVVVAVANLLNAGLDVLLVLRWGWGLDGAAWATVAAEVTAVLLFVLLLRRVGLPLAGHGRPDRSELAALVRVSRDLFVRTGGLVLGLLVVHTAAARISAVTAAAHQVLWQVWIIVSFFMDGFAIAAQAMVGNALGAGRPAAARETARDLLLWGVGGGAAVAVVLLAVAGPLPRVLTDEPEVLAVVATAWWLAAGGHVLNGTVFVLDGVFMGAGDFAYLRTWTVVAAVVAGVGAQVVASADLGRGDALVWLWVAIEAMMVVRLGSLLWRLRGDTWSRTGDKLPAEVR